MDGARHNERLPDGKVANGNWNPDNAKVYLNWNYANNRNGNNGARAEISRTKEPLRLFVRLGDNPP